MTHLFYHFPFSIFIFMLPVLFVWCFGTLRNPQDFSVLFCFTVKKKKKKKDGIILHNGSQPACFQTQNSSAVHFLTNTILPFIPLPVVYNY